MIRTCVGRSVAWNGGFEFQSLKGGPLLRCPDIAESENAIPHRISSMQDCDPRSFITEGEEGALNIGLCERSLVLFKLWCPQPRLLHPQRVRLP